MTKAELAIGTIDGSAIYAILMAFVLLALTSLASWLCIRLARKLLSIDGVPLPSCSILEIIVRIAIWVTGISIALSTCFGIDVGGLLAALGIGGVALSLGLQDTISNFISGLQITLMGIVHPGDHVVIGSTEGIVQDITWRQTVVKDLDYNMHVIPNNKVSSDDVVKCENAGAVCTAISFTNDTRDIDETIATMERLAKEAIEQVTELERDPWILLTQIGEYGTWGKLRFVLKDMSHVREARDAALRAISAYTRVNPEDL